MLCPYDKQTLPRNKKTPLMDAQLARFSVGQLVRHKLFRYRGLIFDLDPCFQGDEKWYEQVALSRPPREQPWYRVLVHKAMHTTYVAERNLLADDAGEAIVHPLTNRYFTALENGVYQKIQAHN